MNSFNRLSQDEAKAIMESEDCLILDVREEEEYKEGHIKDAKLLALSTLNEMTAKAVIPTKDTKLLVYCRSGRRSLKAADRLATFGYTDINEFGGIITWPYELEK